MWLFNAFHPFDAGAIAGSFSQDISSIIIIFQSLKQFQSVNSAEKSLMFEVGHFLFLCSCIALHREFLAFCKDKFRIGVAIAKCVAFDLRFQDISSQLTLVSLDFPQSAVLCKLKIN